MRVLSERLPTVNPDVVAQRVGEDVVLVHLKTNQIYALNETGARFWELLVEGRSRDKIERALREEFDVAPEPLRRDIDALITDLARQDIVRDA
jgi:Coenzyme PQQ synthesis protein D (PqqD)